MIRLYKNAEPASPPTDRVTLYCDVVDGNFKMKREDGTVVVFAGSATGSETVVEYFTLDAGQITAKEVTLANTPIPANQTALDVISCGPQFYSDDFLVSGNILTWAGKPLESVLATGDRLRVQYRK